MACNDYILLETCLYRILQKNFGQNRQYTQLLDLFHEVLILCKLGPPAWVNLLQLLAFSFLLNRSMMYFDCACHNKGPHCFFSGLPILNLCCVLMARNKRITLCVQTTHQTAVGQLLDTLTAPIGTVICSLYFSHAYICFAVRHKSADSPQNCPRLGSVDRTDGVH